MKKFITLLFLLLIATVIFAQAPQKMSYQAVIRDGSNALVTSTSIGMQISILQGSIDGEAVYIETHNPTTNANGLVSIEIGDGTNINGEFSEIDWGNGPFFVKTETDPSGGNSYSITGTSQLLSVPYALYAESSGSSSCLTVETIQVFEGDTSLDWRILDFSDVVGKNHAAVTFRVTSLTNSGLNFVSRQIGDTIDYGFESSQSNHIVFAITGFLTMVTDSEGRIEWKCDRVILVRIDIESYVK